MRAYEPKDWYWFVGGDKTKVFSSLGGNYVLVNNAAYLNWVTSGGVATNIDTEANLGVVLAQYDLKPVPAAVLDGYQGEQVGNKIPKGVFKILFNYENRVRVLEGKPPITQVQFIAALKGVV